MKYCVIHDYKFTFLEDKWYVCEGCSQEVKSIHLIYFTKAELWLCDECLESLKYKLDKKGGKK